MPYDYIRPSRAADDGRDQEDDEARIQEELRAWRVNMREERQRRLHAATVRGERARSRGNAPPPHTTLPLSIHEEDDRAQRCNREVETLQGYREALSEVASKLHNGKNLGWGSGAPTRPPRRTNNKPNVRYYKAQSVLGEYIRRPTQPCPNVPKTSLGTLQAYRDALALSAKACSDASGIASCWHQRPLRSINAKFRLDGTAKHVFVPSTRSTILRKRHVESSHVNSNNGDGRLKLGVSGTLQNRHDDDLSRRPSHALQQTGTSRSGMLQPERQSHSRSHSLGPGQRSSRSYSPSRCCSQRRLTVQPMVTSSVDSLQPRRSPRMPRPCSDDKPGVLHQTPAGVVPPTEVIVSPLTPASEGSDTVPQDERQPRRTPMPVLAELLSKLAPPTSLLSRPDLYQGHTRLGSFSACSTRLTTAMTL